MGKALTIKIEVDDDRMTTTIPEINWVSEECLEGIGGFTSNLSSEQENQVMEVLCEVQNKLCEIYTIVNGG